MNRFSRAIILFLSTVASLLLAGCAGQKAAASTARILVGQTTKLNAEINNAVRSEETNYNSAVLILGRSSARNVMLIQDDAVIRSSQDFARAVLGSKTISDADVRDLLEKATREAWVARKEALARSAAETEALTTSLKKLQAKSDALDGVRKGLESLQKDPSTETEGRELYDWTKKVINGVNKSN
jgi:hypothetical protein